MNDANNPLVPLSRACRAELRRLAVVESQAISDMRAVSEACFQCSPGQEHHLEAALAPQRAWLTGLAAALVAARTALAEAQASRPYVEAEARAAAAGLIPEAETLVDAREALQGVAGEALMLTALLEQLEAAPDAVQGRAFAPGELDQLVIGVLGMHTALHGWGRDIAGAVAGGKEAAP